MPKKKGRNRARPRKRTPAKKKGGVLGGKRMGLIKKLIKKKLK